MQFRMKRQHTALHHQPRPVSSRETQTRRWCARRKRNTTGRHPRPVNAPWKRGNGWVWWLLRELCAEPYCPNALRRRKQQYCHCWSGLGRQLVSISVRVHFQNQSHDGGRTEDRSTDGREKEPARRKTRTPRLLHTRKLRLLRNPGGRGPGGAPVPSQKINSESSLSPKLIAAGKSVREERIYLGNVQRNGPSPNCGHFSVCTHPFHPHHTRARAIIPKIKEVKTMPSGILVREQRRQRKEQKRLLKLQRCGAIEPACLRLVLIRASTAVPMGQQPSFLGTMRGRKALYPI